jgi:hypothetical protein
MSKNYCKPFKRGASWRSQNFRSNPNNGTNGPGGHTGDDEAAPTGTPVHAAGDGVVIYAGTFDSTYADNFLWLLDFGGNILVLDCGDDEPTFIYAHLSRFRVAVGDRVRKGQIIADSGNTGTRTTGAHLHLEAIPPGYTLHSPTLGRTDPDLYLTEWPEDLATITPLSDSITTYLEENNMATLDLDDLKAIQGFVNTSEGRIIADNRAQIAHYANQLGEKLANTAYEIKVFTQAVDNENTDRSIHDNRAQHQS